MSIYAARAAREAPPEFGHLSGAVTGAHNLMLELEGLMAMLMERQPPERRPCPDFGQSIEAMALQIVRTQGRSQILIEVLKELVALGK